MKVTNEHLMSKMESLELLQRGNSRDIVELYKIINMGKGSVRVLLWIGTIVVAVLGWRYKQ